MFFLALAVISYLALAPLDAVSLSTGWDKLNHLLAFAVLLLLLDWAYPVMSVWPSKLLMLFTYGFLIEFAQAFIPYREFSLLDVAADCLGLVVYLLLRPVLLRYRVSVVGGSGRYGQ